MTNESTSCISVSDVLKCNRCSGSNIVKNGKTKNKKQQYICKKCKHRFIEYYSYVAYTSAINDSIILLTKEGLGIRGIARVLKISTNTVIRRIVTIAKYCKAPAIVKGKVYEIDEIRSFVKRKTKLIWIVYALERESKKVVAFNIGSRTKATLHIVTDRVILLEPRCIYTDKLIHYKFLINDTIHKTKRFGTNHIERKNLTLRTHLKRLNRKTICYSRSKSMLMAVLKIYFWS